MMVVEGLVFDSRIMLMSVKHNNVLNFSVYDNVDLTKNSVSYF